jgi:hypothetical protein
MGSGSEGTFGRRSSLTRRFADASQVSVHSIDAFFKQQ